MSAQLSLERVADIIRTPADTLVLLHRNPDADAVGSAYALKKMLEAFGSCAYCVCGDELPQRLRFLMRGEQESLLPENIPASFSYTRVISVDTASPSQLGRLAPMYASCVDLMIDHHGNGECYAKEVFIRPDAAATGEILYDLLKMLSQNGEMEITEPVCAALYAAISSDTGGFRYSNTKQGTHVRAGELLSFGIDASHINHLLFECKSAEQIRAEAAGASRLEVFGNGAVAVITFPYELKASLGLADGHLETLIEVARSLAGVQVAISIRQMQNEGVFRVSMRSSCDYDVACLCKHFGGGGHAKAAGCTVCADDIERAKEQILSQIDFSSLN